MMDRIAHLALAALLSLGPAATGSAQTFTVSSITTTDLGTVVAAPSGQTIFRTNPATGTVTTVSGSGSRLTTGTARSLVTISCGLILVCDTVGPTITIATTGTPTGRAATLQNLAVSTSGASGVISSPPAPGAPITFTLGPVGSNSSKTFWVGFDFPVNGDTSGGNTGVSTAQFSVTAVLLLLPTSTLAGMARATVFRGLSLSRTANLNFGRIVRPRTGTGTVSLAQATGAVTVTGTGAVALASPTPTAAAFTASGEGGQSISVTVPSSFTMTGPSGALTVTTAPNVSGAQVLSGTLGSAGNLPIRVGGSFPIGASTATGSYSGTFSVTVQYN